MPPGPVEVPKELPDRAADGWEPLIVIAQVAAGAWPPHARLAAIGLSAESEILLTVGVQLLRDIREAFDGAGASYLQTRLLLEQLHEMEESPWGDWYGRALSAHALAKLLSPYGIGPRRQRLEGKNLRGYWSADFEDAWVRYLPVGLLATGISDTSGTVEQDVPDVPEVPLARRQTGEQEPLPGWVTDPDPEA
jgi:Protein of unknown function (DUF3631)